MELLGPLLGLVVEPVSLAVVVLVIVVLLIVKGSLIPRKQSDALIAQHERVHATQDEVLKVTREDRDSTVASMTEERDLWRATANDAQDVAAEVRAQNSKLIDSLEAVDHLVSELRSMTGVGVDNDSGKP